MRVRVRVRGRVRVRSRVRVRIRADRLELDRVNVGPTEGITRSAAAAGRLRRRGV